MFRSHFFFIFVYLSLAPTLLHSQEEVIPIHFQVYLWPGGPNPNMEAAIREMDHQSMNDMIMPKYVPPTIQFSPYNNAEKVKIEAAERRLSPSYQYFGNGPLTFFREMVGFDGSSHRVILGSVTIPQDYSRTLLLFFPNPDSSDTYRIIPIENSRQDVPPGNANIINLTQQTVACLFGEKRTLLESGAQEVVPVQPNERLSLLVRLGAESEDGEWRERHAQQLIINPDDSITALIYTKPGKADAYRILKILNPK